MKNMKKMLKDREESVRPQSMIGEKKDDMKRNCCCFWFRGSSNPGKWSAGTNTLKGHNLGDIVVRM